MVLEDQMSTNLFQALEQFEAAEIIRKNTPPTRTRKQVQDEILALRPKLEIPEHLMGDKRIKSILESAAVQAAKGDLRFFYPKAFESLNPDDEFTYNWHYDYIAYMLQRTLPEESGLNPTPDDRIRNLIINVPPRSGKSWELTAYRAFIFGHYPHERIISASYSNGLSLQLNGDTRQVVTSDWYKQLFPDTMLVKEAENFWTTTKKGESKCTSTGGTITGFGGNYIIADDMLNPELSFSPIEREKANRFCQKTLFNRVNNKRKAVKIVVMQRLHEEDLTGLLLHLNKSLPKENQWHHICLPAIAEETKTYKFYDREYTWYEGTPLQPIRETIEDIEAIKIEQGITSFTGQYQQRPAPEGGGLIRLDQFARYREVKQEDIKLTIQSWDTGIAVEKSNDPSVCLTWYFMKDGTHILADVYSKKMLFSELKAATVNLYKQHKANVVIIENKGSGQSLIQELKMHHKFMNVIAANPDKEKTERVNRNIFTIETGKVGIPCPLFNAKPWLSSFENEVLMFPFGKHDDQIDAMSQYLDFMRKQYGRTPRIRVMAFGSRNRQIPSQPEPTGEQRSQASSEQV